VARVALLLKKTLLSSNEERRALYRTKPGANPAPKVTVMSKNVFCPYPGYRKRSDLEALPRVLPAQMAAGATNVGFTPYLHGRAEKSSGDYLAF
jgi:hypothetical protein